MVDLIGLECQFNFGEIFFLSASLYLHFLWLTFFFLFCLTAFNLPADFFEKFPLANRDSRRKSLQCQNPTAQHQDKLFIVQNLVRLIRLSLWQPTAG